MKISYRTAAVGAGAYTVLGDESDRTATIRDYQPQMEGIAQVNPLFRSAKQFVADRKNRVWKLSFIIERTHASLGAAVDFLATHPAALPSNVDLKIEQGATVLYLVKAVMVAFQPMPRGLSTACGYAYVGDYTTTAP
jgi:hypothetical protein